MLTTDFLFMSIKKCMKIVIGALSVIVQDQIAFERAMANYDVFIQGNITQERRRNYLCVQQHRCISEA